MIDVNRIEKAMPLNPSITPAHWLGSMLASGVSIFAQAQTEHETRATVDPILAARQSSESDAPAPSDLEQKIESVLPAPREEHWLRVPWQQNLMKARLEAQAAAKPMLIWVMDGNVLGCT